MGVEKGEEEEEDGIGTCVSFVRRGWRRRKNGRAMVNLMELS